MKVRNTYKNKLKALLEGLETQHIDMLIKKGKVGDYRKYGKAYFNASNKQNDGKDKP